MTLKLNFSCTSECVCSSLTEAEVRLKEQNNNLSIRKDLDLTLLGGLGDLLELVAAELLRGLCLQDVSVFGSSFIQSLVCVLIVHQRPAPPVQQVLQRVTSTCERNMLLQQKMSRHDVVLSPNGRRADKKNHSRLTFAAWDSLR